MKMPLQPLPVGVPVGTVVSYMGKLPSPQGGLPSNIISPGWMVCDGASLSKSEYPELYAAIGDLYGSGQTADMFQIPNLQGMFLRGVGTDPASIENRTLPDGSTGSGVGSLQQFALQTHVHTTNAGATAVGGTSGSAVVSYKPATDSSEPQNVNLSPLETRPINIFVYFIIKYTSFIPTFNQPFL